MQAEAEELQRKLREAASSLAASESAREAACEKQRGIVEKLGAVEAEYSAVKV